MPHPKRVGDMEVGQDMAYQRREWLVERIGWIVMATVVLAALLGLLGRGPLSSAERGDHAGTLRLEYERFLHYRDQSTLTVTIDAGSPDAEQVRLWLSRSYLETMRPLKITPAPEREEIGGERQVFVFRRADRDVPVRVIFHVEPDDFGSVSGKLGIDGGAALDFWQFVYP
jgi:hypothetical protein